MSIFENGNFKTVKLPKKIRVCINRYERYEPVLTGRNEIGGYDVYRNVNLNDIFAIECADGWVADSVTEIKDTNGITFCVLYHKWVYVNE